MNKILDRQQFEKLLGLLNVSKEIDVDFLYDIYQRVFETVIYLINATEGIQFTPVSHVSVLLYIINEYTFSTMHISKDKIPELLKDEKFAENLASGCADKYITNEQLDYKSQAFLNKFNPPISTLNLYLNFILRILNSINPTDKYSKLVNDMLKKAFSMGKCILKLLTDGFETEAFSTWRTLHENESILICLIRNGETIFDEYFKHIKYALAYRGQIKEKEELDDVFGQIKSEMKAHDLKSKDMKKFIEYGYLFAIPDIKLNEDFKLNFRDGVEKLAGLSNYNKIYEMSSEISHSSPLLIYSRKEYYFGITLLCLYESFFRLEPIFYNFYHNFAMPEIFETYRVLQKTYIHQLLYIYNELKNNLVGDVE